jgi:hypothetical protein
LGAEAVNLLDQPATDCSANAGSVAGIAQALVRPLDSI